MPDAYTSALQSTLLAAQPAGVGVPGIAAPTLAPAPVAAPAPAKGLEGLKAGWFDFLKGVRENPEQQQAFLRMGLQLLQPVQPGQTTAGHVSQAALQGMDYLTQVKALADSGALTQKQLWDRAVELAGKVYEADRPFMGNEAFELKYPKGAIALAQDYFTRMGGQLLPVKEAGEKEPGTLGLKGTKENPHILKTQQDYAD